MKTIQLLILTLFLSAPTLTNAQDATNDATWEETINFISSKSSFYGSELLGSVKDWKVADNKLSFWIGKLSTGHHKEKIDLLKMERIEYKRNNYIQIFLIGEYAMEKVYTHNERLLGERYFNYFTFQIKDKEMRVRVFKALKHLAYLATQKREEDRNASGSKF